jgi:hypothetical protein
MGRLPSISYKFPLCPFKELVPSHLGIICDAQLKLHPCAMITPKLIDPKQKFHFMWNFSFYSSYVLFDKNILIMNI